MQPLQRMVALTSVVVISGCAAQTSPAVDLALEEQAISEADQRLLAAAQAGDAAAFAAIFAPDGEMLFPNRPRAIGQEAIQAAAAGDFAVPGFRVTWQQSNVMIAQSGDLAVSTGNYQLTLTPPSGRIDDRGKYMTVWRKVDGEWRVAADMINTDVPMPEM